MPFLNGPNIDLELWHNVGRGHSSKRRGRRILRDKQHPVGRVNLERNAACPTPMITIDFNALAAPCIRKIDVALARFTCPT